MSDQMILFEKVLPRDQGLTGSAAIAHFLSDHPWLGARQSPSMPSTLDGSGNLKVLMIYGGSAQMRKINICLSMDMDNFSTMRTVAMDLGVSCSALFNRLLEIASETLDPDALRQWAAEHQRVKEPAQKMKGTELAVLKVLRQTEWIALEDVIRRSGKTKGIARRALKALAAAGKAESRDVTGYNNPELKEWHDKGHRGPCVTLWRIRQTGQAVDPAEID